MAMKQVENVVLVRLVTRILLRIGWTTAALVNGLMLWNAWSGYRTAATSYAMGSGRLVTVMEAFGSTFLLAAIVLWWMALDLVLIKWLVPLGRGGCPGCGYDLSGLKGKRCPECGVGEQGEGGLRAV